MQQVSWCSERVDLSQIPTTLGRRRARKKRDPRNLDGTMFKNHSLPTSYSQSSVEGLSKSTEAEEAELVPRGNGVEETAIYDNLTGQEQCIWCVVMMRMVKFA